MTELSPERKPSDGISKDFCITQERRHAVTEIGVLAAIAVAAVVGLFLVY